MPILLLLINSRDALSLKLRADGGQVRGMALRMRLGSVLRNPKRSRELVSSLGKVSLWQRWPLQRHCSILVGRSQSVHRHSSSATATAAGGHRVMATVMPQQLALLKALATTVAALVSASGGTRSNSRTLTIPSNAQPTTVASYLFRCIDQLDNTWDHSNRHELSEPAA